VRDEPFRHDHQPVAMWHPDHGAVVFLLAAAHNDVIAELGRLAFGTEPHRRWVCLFLHRGQFCGRVVEHFVLEVERCAHRLRHAHGVDAAVRHYGDRIVHARGAVRLLPEAA